MRKIKQGYLFLVPMYRWIIIFLVSIVCASAAQAQKSKDGNQITDGRFFGYDSGYVISFRDNFVLTLVNETKASHISVAFNGAKNSYLLDYKTNTINTWGIGLDYKWFTFEFTTKLPGYTPDPQYGDIKSSGLGFGFTGRKLAFRNFFEKNTGYYLTNTDEWLPGYRDIHNHYYLRPDISTFMYYSSLNYVFNNKHFSNNASLWQLERQNRKAGTFVSGLTYIFNNFNADSSIIPYTGIDSLPRSNNTYFALNSVGINMGYMGTLPFGKRKKLFVTVALIPGISRQWGDITIENVGVKQVKGLWGLQSEFRLGIGYNGDRWYVGSIAKNYSNTNHVNSTEPFSIGENYGRFYVGYRFNSPQIKNKYLKMIGF